MNGYVYVVVVSTAKCSNGSCSRGTKHCITTTATSCIVSVNGVVTTDLHQCTGTDRRYWRRTGNYHLPELIGHCELTNAQGQIVAIGAAQVTINYLN